MKKFENMSVDQKRAYLLRTVASNVTFEGHYGVAKEFLNEAQELEEKIKSTLEKSNHQKYQSA